MEIPKKSQEELKVTCANQLRVWRKGQVRIESWSHIFWVLFYKVIVVEYEVLGQKANRGLEHGDGLNSEKIKRKKFSASYLNVGLG